MKFQTVISGFLLCLISTMAQANSTLPGREVAMSGWPASQVTAGFESSVTLAPATGATQHKPATVSPQAGDNAQDGHTGRLVLLTLLVMGSIALRRSRSAR